MRLRFSTKLLLLFVVSAASSSQALAATRTVNDAGDADSCSPASCTIRGALTASSDGDEIVIAESITTITPATPLLVTKTLTIRSGGATRPTFTGTTSIFTFDNSDGGPAIRAVFRGLRFANIVAPLDGSAIRDTTGGTNQLLSIEVRDCAFENNQNASGGPAINSRSALRIESSLFIGNSATGSIPTGGAVRIDFYGAVVITRSTFRDNNVGPTGPSTNPGNGGAIGGSSSAVFIKDSTFNHNNARQGGAIYLSSGNILSLRNSTFTDNTTLDLFSGEAIHTENANEIVLNNVTVAGNHGPTGSSGAAAITFEGSTRFHASNSIITGNAGNSCFKGFAGDNIQSLGHNVVHSSCISGNTYSQHASDVIVDVDPGLATALADNGGPTQTLAIIAAALANDLGDPTLCEKDDQRGVYRPHDSCDAGAYELIQNPDLALSKTVDKATASVGDTLTYTISVTNSGAGGATGVLVQDPLPGEVTYVSATASSGACSFSSGIVSCTIDSIAAGATATVTIVATVNHAGIIDNVAIVNGNETDDNLNNNTGGTRTTVDSASCAPVVQCNDANAFITGQYSGGGLAQPGCQASGHPAWLLLGVAWLAARRFRQ